MIQTLGRAEDGVTSSRALLALLHNTPDIPSPRKKLRTKPWGDVESTFQAMGWVISQLSSGTCSGTVTMSPNIPGHTTPHTPPASF